MTGPEHFAAGEALLSAALRDGGIGSQLAPVRIAAAQAHFTAALAAATALGREGSGGTMPDNDRGPWFDVASTRASAVRGVAS